jgi:hypothetical protein
MWLNMRKVCGQARSAGRGREAVTRACDKELLSILRMFIYYDKKRSDRWIRARSLYAALKQWRES